MIKPASFRSVSDMVSDFKSVDLQLPDMDFRARAGMLVASRYGMEMSMRVPEMVNFAGLTLSLDRVVVHELTPGVIGLVHETDLHSLPDSAPALISRPFVVESKRFDCPLFLKTVSIGGYWLEGKLYIAGIQYPDGAMVASWDPVWNGGELSPDPESTALIDNVESHLEWKKEALRFMIILSILFEAEKVPIRGKDEETRKQRKASRKNDHDWTVRRISLSKTYQTSRESAGTADLDKTGRTAESVPIRGYLKRQHYGPGSTLRKWLWIEGFQARRWVGSKPVRIVVKE